MDRSKGIIKTSIIGILGNLFLVAFKAFVGIVSSSISIITDAINNLTDALSSTITIVGTALSNKKPDKKHPFGHGRVEYITSTIIAVIILIAGVTAIVESIKSLVEGSSPSYTNISLIIISVAIAVKVFLGILFIARSKKYESDLLKNSGKDALFDAILSLSTLIAAIISRFAGFNIEGYLGIVIGLFIIKSGIEAISESLSEIIGERADEELIKSLKELILSFPEVKGVFDLIVNNYGVNKKIASVHIEIDDKLTARDIQFLERNIQGAVYTNFGIIITVGIYASNDSSELSKEIKDYLFNEIKKYPTIIQCHGFYVDEKLKMITYDLIISFDEKNPEEVFNNILNAMNEKFSDFNIYPVLDTNFSD